MFLFYMLWGVWGFTGWKRSGRPFWLQYHSELPPETDQTSLQLPGLLMADGSQLRLSVGFVTGQRELPRQGQAPHPITSCCLGKKAWLPCLDLGPPCKATQLQSYPGGTAEARCSCFPAQRVPLPDPVAALTFLQVLLLTARFHTPPPRRPPSQSLFPREST